MSERLSFLLLVLVLVGCAVTPPERYTLAQWERCLQTVSGRDWMRCSR